MSLELRDGKPMLLMDYGTGVSRLEIEHSPMLADGLSHKVHITWNPSVLFLIYSHQLYTEYYRVKFNA